MRLNRKAITRIEHSFSDLLRGMPVALWAEKKSLELLQLSDHTGPPVSLEISKKLLRTRRIRDIKYKLELPENGRLAVGDDGFIIELAQGGQYSAGWLRLTLAHELAHSLFYNIDAWPPLPLVSTVAGDPDLEWLCWQLAKALLVPQTWLREHLKQKPELSSREFSLKTLYELEKTFSVPWKVIGQRLVEDLELWNVILLHFVKGDENLDAVPTKNTWYLQWQTVPSVGTEKLFIPFGRRVEGIMKLPRARGSLLDFISSCAEKGKSEPLFTTQVPYEALKTSTTGNLGKFLQQLFGNRDFPVACAFKSRPQYEMFGDEQPTSHSMIMCFPLPPAFI